MRHTLTIALTVPGSVWVYIFLMALVSTAIARLLMFQGLVLLGGTQVALIGVAEPVLVLLGSIFLFGEQLSLWQWFGAGLVVISVALAGVIAVPGASPL